MRYFLNVLVLVAVLFGPRAQAGPDGAGRGPLDAWGMHSRKTVLKLHPLSTAGGMVFGTLMLPLEVEHAVTPDLSWYGTMAPLIQLDHSWAPGLALGCGVRGYLSGHAPDGPWLGAQLGITVLGSPRWGTTGTSDLQPQAGYQWVLGNGFTVGVGAGLSIRSLVLGTFPVTVMVPIGFAW
jgi:hypothetical protein